MQIIQDVSEIKKIHNWFIVDVGYSNSRKSCGVVIVRNNEVIEKKDIVFSGMKEKFQKFYDKCENEKIGLILEAPLSMAFDKNKNPLGRKELEKEEGVTRYWYYGAGATVTLGALEFINRIKNILTCNIYLFEGFVSFKKNENENRKKDEHWKDAMLLYKSIKNNKLHEENIVPKDGERYIFIGDYLNLEINGIPPIVKISKENKKEIFMIKS
ncbi:hypothetical protein ACLHDG_13620 [Sulfurovum sp. CS9]|uniref:hypothetical protein n=1 Tax=Sulfurovum sp. CS9 TaxID=3391146 RepID=UPI0039E95A92